MNDVEAAAEGSVDRAEEAERPYGDRRGERIPLKDQAVSAALWAAGAGWLAPMMGTMTLLQQLVSPERIEPLSRLYCRGQVALTGSRWRAVVHPDVNPNAQYMFVQNHTNYFDHVAMYNATPHFKQGLELESHFSIPFYGWFMRSRGTIPVPKNRGTGLRAVIDNMRTEVDKGRSILAFPEGTRTLDGRVGRFRRGVFVMARHFGLPVVPVAVTGMYDVMRKGAWVIRPGHTVTVHVDEPIPTAGLDDEGLQQVIDESRRVIAARVDEYFERKRSRGAT